MEAERLCAEIDHAVATGAPDLDEKLMMGIKMHCADGVYAEIEQVGWRC